MSTEVHEPLSTEDTKSIIESKTAWAAVATAAVAIVPSVVTIIKVPDPPCLEPKPIENRISCKDRRWNQQVEEVSKIVLAVVGAIATIYSRATATKTIR